MTPAEGPPRREISDPVFSGRREAAPDVSRRRRIGINALGAVLAAIGVLGLVQAGVIDEQRSTEIAAAAQAYSEVDEQARAVEEDIRLMPRPQQAGRWVSAASDAAASIAVKQDFFMDATSPWDSGVLEPTEPLQTTPGRDPDPEALRQHHEDWVAGRVSQTERELVMLFAPDQRDLQGLNAASAWHEAISGLPEDVSGYSWSASPSPSVGRSIRVPVTWVLTQDTTGEQVAMMTGYYQPHGKVFQDVSLMILDREGGQE